MKLEDLLRERKEKVLKRWFRHVVKTYPGETARFLLSEKNPFDNPVGSNILKGIEEVLDQLTSGQAIDTVNPFIERMVRIRAVQDFRPSEAVAFVFSLKDIVAEELGNEAQKKEFHDEMAALDRRIDSLALLVFDAYTNSREKVCEIKLNEVKNRVARLLKRANLLAELEEDTDGEDVHH